MSADQTLEAGLAQYGATGASQLKSRRARIVQQLERPSIGIIAGCVVIPTLIFIATFWLISFNLRFWSNSLAFMGALVVLVVCLVFGGMTAAAAMGKVSGNPAWLGILFILSLSAWFYAFIAGNCNFHDNMQIFYELETMNVYESVDPSTSQGNQYMDFGVFNFASGASIDRKYTMAFVNEDVYCVAPIKLGNSSMTTYDYWAVGTNCCSKHLFNFNCGAWNNPAARSGLRVMNEKDRSFYRLAVQQAEAAYDIPVHHPVFMTWVQNPADQILGYEQNGHLNLYLGTFYVFFASFFLVALAGWCVPHFPKM
jgi:hypothetical protein